MKISNEVSYAYAKAVFSLAVQQDELTEWGTFLKYFAVIAQTQAMVDYCARPLQQPQKLLLSIFDDFAIAVTPPMVNFVKLILLKKRWSLLVNISEIYQDMLAEHLHLLRVKIIAAVQLTEDEKQKIIEELTHRYACSIELQQEVDAALIGGAILHIKDKVIDGSVAGQLQRVKKYL